MRKRQMSAIVAMLAMTFMAACSGGDTADDTAADTTTPAPAPAPAPAPTGTAGAPPTGATPEMVTAGQATFTTVCVACHGPDAKGIPNLGPNLTDAEWINNDGTYDAIINTVKTGVPVPKAAAAAMPPLGGASLTEDQVRAVAAYVWALGGGK